jgi:hypothetical protein
MSQDKPVEATSDTFYNNPAEAEPIVPTEEADVTKQETQKPEQEVEIIEKPAEAEAEAEEAESEDEIETAQYLELDGNEVNLDDVRKWRDGHLMQSDYTKKTTDLAEERKTFKAESESGREQLLNDQAKINDMKDMLSVLVSEDEAIDWAELKEDDPDRYIELKEKADKRKEALEKVKSERQTPANDPALVQAEQAKLFEANPDWFDDKNEPTDTYKADMKLINDYGITAGFTVEEFSQITQAHHMNTILKAAKYDALQEKGRVIKAKREKVPVTTTPKATSAASVSKDAADVFYGEKTG